MQRQLYPMSVGEESLEQYAAVHLDRGGGIYLGVALLIVAGCAALPIARVDVMVQSRGIVRPLVDKRDVRAGVAGMVGVVVAHEHQSVVAGQLVATLRAAIVDQRDASLAELVEAKRHEIVDLELLDRAASGPSIPVSQFQSPVWRQEYVEFTDELVGAATQQVKATNDLARTRTLYDRGFATVADLEDRQLAADRARDNAGAIVDRYRVRWQQALAALRLESHSLQSQRRLMEEERSSYMIRAPIAGTIEELASVSPNSYVERGERIAMISPASPLVAEVYVSPRDIGLLHVGMPTRVLIDAFNYNDWGVVTGRVLDISTDFVEISNQPMFKVHCALDQDHLQLTNGYRGALKKGMTLNARFLIARRSLLQLLREGAADRLNPTTDG